MKNKLIITEILMKKFLLILFAFLFVPGILEAQVNKKAQVGFRFLENPVSAEVVGRGMVGIVNTYNSDGIFWNPALTGMIQSSVDLSFNHTRGIADINYNAVSAAVRAGDFGVVGVSLLAMDYGTFYQTRRAANDVGYIETGTFSPAAISAGISFSQQVTNRFSYGVHVKYAYQDLGDAWISTSGDSLSDPNLLTELKTYDNGTIAADVGAFYDFQYNGIKFGAVLQNISRELRYEQQNFPLPFAVSFGATVEPMLFIMDRNNDHRFVLSFESRHPRDFGEKLKIGGEYVFGGMFFARVGYVTNYDERRWSAGIGVNYTLSSFPLRLNYAIQPYGIFGNIHYLSIGISYL
jgi:hypothetical protein